MGSSARVLRRMQERLTALSANFPTFLDVFEGAKQFSGPSFYFHQKAIAAHGQHHSVASLLQDDHFLELIYATLTAWGMHRMGPGNTKLRDFPDFVYSLRGQSTAILQLEHLSFLQVPHAEVAELGHKIWTLIQAIQISVAKAQVVANSKALHHILPNLVPPIDREYTYNLFYSRNMLSISEEEAFLEILAGMHELGTQNSHEISRRIGTGWHTSPTKVIDNAIIGYMLAKKRRLPA